MPQLDRKGQWALSLFHSLLLSASLIVVKHAHCLTHIITLHLPVLMHTALLISCVMHSCSSSSSSSSSSMLLSFALTACHPLHAFPPPASPPLSPSPSPSPQPAALTPPTFPPQRTMPATPPELPGTQPTSGDEGTGRGQATPGDSSGDTGQGEGGAGDSGDNKGDGKGRDGEGDDSPGGSSNGSKQAKSGSIVGAWMDVVVVPMMFVVIGIMAWAAYMYRGVLTRQYQQLRTDLDQELVSPSTQYTRV
eukprot:1160608-Pelagomonas_calceolata.AAC.14